MAAQAITMESNKPVQETPSKSSYALTPPIEVIAKNTFSTLENGKSTSILSFFAAEWPHPSFLFPYTPYKTPLMTDAYKGSTSNLDVAGWPQSCSFPAGNNQVSSVFLLAYSENENVYIEEEDSWVLNFAKTDTWDLLFSVNLKDNPALNFLNEQDSVVRGFIHRNYCSLLTKRGYLLNFTKGSSSLTYGSHLEMGSYDKCEQMGFSLVFLKGSKVTIFSMKKQKMDEDIAFPPALCEIMSRKNFEEGEKIYPPYICLGKYLVATHPPKAFVSADRTIKSPWALESSFLMSQSTDLVVAAGPLVSGKREMEIITKKDGTKEKSESLKEVRALVHPDLGNILLDFNETTVKVRVLSAKEFVFQSKLPNYFIQDICLGKDRLYILYKTQQFFSLHEVILGQTIKPANEREDSPYVPSKRSPSDTPGKSLTLSSQRDELSEKTEIRESSFWESTGFKIAALVLLLGIGGGIYLYQKKRL